MMPTEIDLQLTPDSKAISAARHSLDDLEGQLHSETLGHLRMLVSELVTNSVRHAHLGPDESIRLGITTFSDSVFVEVMDSGAGFEKPTHPSPRPEMTSGWGLYLIEQLSERWGVEQDGGPTRVWFELAR